MAKDGYTHWKDKSNGCDTWRDNTSKIHTQACYTSCDTLKNGTVTVTLAACQNKTGVNFAHAGSAPKIVCTVTAPATCKHGAVITYSCTVTNTGNACFSKGCNVSYQGGSITCPNLSPGQSCTITKTYTCTQAVGVTFSCPVTAYGYHPTGSCSASATCSTKVTN